MISLAGCGPSSKLRRAERLIKKAELQGAVWSHDTVYVTRGVIIPEIHFDTLLIAKPGDTIRVEKERLRLRVVQMPGDTIFVDAECRSDTVRIEVPVSVANEITADCRIKWWWLLIAGVIGVVFGRIVLKLLV